MDDGEQCDDGNRINGDGCSSDCKIECGGEGCTPGFWKQPHHLDSWQGVGPDDNFNATFDTNATFNAEQCGSTNPTLLEALKCQGGGLSALARHAVRLGDRRQLPGAPRRPIRQREACARRRGQCCARRCPSHSTMILPLMLASRTGHDLSQR